MKRTTGVGQIYNGHIGKGFGFIAIQIVSVLLIFLVIGFITTPIIWIWGIVDAYKSAERINAGLKPASGSLGTAG